MTCFIAESKFIGYMATFEQKEVENQKE
ncbi:hypothetical protein BCEP4_320011 [Burkholderia cepacia]|nr:hypothetical protein BCEP4_320011 [Burkholderia cepacia]